VELASIRKTTSTHFSRDRSYYPPGGGGGVEPVSGGTRLASPAAGAAAAGSTALFDFAGFMK